MAETPTTPDLSKITAEKYFADLFSTGIRLELEKIKAKHLKIAEENFKADADKLMKEWIFYMIQNFRVERRNSGQNFRTEIIVQLPILKEIEGFKKEGD